MVRGSKPTLLSSRPANSLVLPLPLYNIFVFWPFFTIQFTIQFTPLPIPPINSQSTIFIQPTSLSTPSHWRYLFPAAYHNHLNSDETNQTSPNTRPQFIRVEIWWYLDVFFLKNIGLDISTFWLLITLWNMPKGLVT